MNNSETGLVRFNFKPAPSLEEGEKIFGAVKLSWVFSDIVECQHLFCHGLQFGFVLWLFVVRFVFFI